MAKSKATDKDYARLGKALQQTLIQDNIRVVEHWQRFVIINFSRGLLVGVGTVVGATLVIALLAWLLSLFNSVPLIGDVFENIRQSIQRSSR